MNNKIEDILEEIEDAIALCDCEYSSEFLKAKKDIKDILYKYFDLNEFKMKSDKDCTGRDVTDVGKELKYIRNENNISQEKLANILEVTPNTISNWEKGRRGIRIGMFNRILNLFGYKLVIMPFNIKNKQGK